MGKKEGRKLIILINLILISQISENKNFNLMICLHARLYILHIYNYSLLYCKNKYSMSIGLKKQKQK